MGAEASGLTVHVPLQADHTTEERSEAETDDVGERDVHGVNYNNVLPIVQHRASRRGAI